MAGTIAADTLTHSTAGSIATNYVVNGSAKAWGYYQFVGGAPTDRDSFNISGLTDIAAGRTTVSFTNNMNSAYYSTAGVSGDDKHVFKRSETSSSFEWASYNAGYADSDMAHTTDGELA